MQFKAFQKQTANDIDRIRYCVCSNSRLNEVVEKKTCKLFLMCIEKVSDTGRGAGGCDIEFTAIQWTACLYTHWK